MATDTRTFGYGTALTQRYPWGFYVGGRALCSDGKVRALARIASTADTFYSVPAAVKVNGRTVSGFITTEDMPRDGDRANYAADNWQGVVIFHAYTKRTNGSMLPDIAAANYPTPEES